MKRSQTLAVVATVLVLFGVALVLFQDRAAVVLAQVRRLLSTAERP